MSISLLGGASEKSFNYVLPFSQGSRPSYDTIWEEAVRGYTIEDAAFALFLKGTTHQLILFIRKMNVIISFTPSKFHTTIQQYFLFFNPNPKGVCKIVFKLEDLGLLGLNWQLYTLP